MDADAAANYQLINGLISVLDKADGQVTASFSRHACCALLSKSLFQTNGASSQQQQVQLANARMLLLDGASKLVSKGSVRSWSTADAAAQTNAIRFESQEAIPVGGAHTPVGM